jgi:hypothetical protein
MILINKSSYLKYKNFRFRCALGKAGIGKKKKEGDNKDDAQHTTVVTLLAQFQQPTKRFMELIFQAMLSLLEAGSQSCRSPVLVPTNLPLQAKIACLLAGI